MIGAMNPGAIIAAQLAQPQQAQQPEPFVWGQGGQRLTPETIARQREIAQSLMQSDYSPIYSPWQGLARVAGNAVGALQSRKLDKAERANTDYSRNQIAQLLTGGGPPSASASPGAPQSSAPGGNLALAQQILADPYADAGAKSIAQMQLKQAQAMQMKQFEYANREPPEIVQLANIARDATQPPDVRKAAQDRITALNDPTLVIPGLPTGTYVGPRSGVGMAFGEAPGAAPDTLPPDFDFDQPPQAVTEDQAAPIIQSASATKRISRSDLAHIESALGANGRAAAKGWMQAQGIQVID